MFRMDTSDELTHMIARPETSTKGRREAFDPIQAWFESTVKKETQAPSPVSPLGMPRLMMQLPPAEPAGYREKREGGDAAPPRFGCMGLATPGSPMTAEKPNWKQLSELPKLDIPAGEAWERNTVLATWQKEVVLASTAVSVQFSDY
eukprot:7524864-Lingulodinium_polyedra.AAC.1